MSQTYYTTSGIPYKLTAGIEGTDVDTKLSQTANCFNAYEVNPSIGCGFGCRYCSMYGQDENETHRPILIFKDYPEHLQKFIENHPDPSALIFDISPKTDFFSDELVESGMTAKFLKVFRDTKVRFFSLTKNGVPTPEIQELLVETREHNQIIISSGIHSRELEERLEPNAPSSANRMDLARFCKNNGITVTGIIAPYIPLNVDETEDQLALLSRFKNAGITHCSLDVLKGSNACLRRVRSIVQENGAKIDKLYFEAPEKDISTYDWRLIDGKIVARSYPETAYVRETLHAFKKIAKTLNMTVSTCVDVCKLVKNPKYNREARAAGFNCVGYQKNKQLSLLAI